MARDQQPASLHLRMSPQLRECLREAANDAGCSLNAFAVQVLSAAAGDASRYRSEPTEVRVAAALPPQKWRLRLARGEFMGVMGVEIGSKEMVALVRRHDAEDPGYYLEWQRRWEAAGSPQPGNGQISA